MARTIRVFWRDQKSGWFNFNWNGVITPQSVVHISACEAGFPENNLFGAEGAFRFRGAAPIYVKNVHPHGPNPGDTITGGVEFYLDIDWDSPLDVATDITVLDPPEDKVVVG
ncbi:hypothetical protein [Mycolicibacterium baixiangningiae]|uniref:hypothetical protein n=1 Tax=Mycolicibacterium baixiangningiae TaxID=2761578 RepID=UPI001869539E|nr:hypothetical protein [Mycolicibacterium baixiangningiae]